MGGKRNKLRIDPPKSLAQTTPMILCDTNILIEFYKNNTQIVQELHHLGQDQLAISIVTQAELYFGAFNKQELKEIKQHLSLLHQISFDLSISKEFLKLVEIYSLSHKLSLPDALIASTALVHDLELYTLNVKDFQFIPNLKLYRP
jgi:predicted nucleic acid-binding protein